MSTSKWAYDPRRCDGQPCPGDCDRCTRWQHDEWLEDESTVGESIPSEETRIKVVYCRDCAKRHNGCPLQVWCGPLDDDYCSRGVPKE